MVYEELYDKFEILYKKRDYIEKFIKIMVNSEKTVDGKRIRFYNLRGFSENLASHRHNL